MAKGKVWFHRSRAIAWAMVGIVSFPLGWASNIALIWCASLYANVFTDWGAGEAADDTAITDRLDRIELLVRRGGCPRCGYRRRVVRRL